MTAVLIPQLPLEAAATWKDGAPCSQTDPEAFYPEKGGSTLPAKLICLRCDVRDQCLAYALEHDERFGIWGGYSERERRRIRRGEAVKPRLVPKANRNANGHGYRCECPLCAELRAALR